MNDTRRDFLKKAALFAGGGSMMNALPPSIQKAMTINPDSGTTFEDAEHVVLLMQENRSFDHVFGKLKGVRGFNDPRAIRLPNGNLAWLQTNEKGDTYAPYRLDINDSKVTWIGGLPHQWGTQVEARNDGKYDKWLEVKKHGDMPFTLGHYSREDLPFYYALADAFTVCDHHFCSSLTGTTPNRLFYWTGTVREKPNSHSPANISNGFVNYGNPADWKTFPERLEEEKISWKIYQNELSVGVGMNGLEESWLANFTDNPIEWFSQYHVRFHPAHVKYMKKRAKELGEEIGNLAQNAKEKEKKQRLLHRIQKGLKKYTEKAFNELPEREQNLHRKAFTTNVNDPYYHDLETIEYDDNGEKRKMELPKGDILDQFRKDVEKGELPTVSWLIGSQRFSDHPSSPWFGELYVSEVLDILTQNPEVWKKTIFILCYDENDGYFDHISPFVAPNPEDKSTGFCSDGINTEVDYVTESQYKRQHENQFKDPGRVSPIGLGYRVPFIVASPWSRGGKVNSQLSDNTSVLMFLEEFLNRKFNKKIKEDNISDWRRTICGDLTSVFTPYNGEEIELPEFIKEKPFYEKIYNAKFKDAPGGYRKVTKKEIANINNGQINVGIMPKQEEGTKTASALPYEFYVNGRIKNENQFEIEMNAAKNFFGDKAVGTAFYVYNMHTFEIRNYAIKAGDTLKDNWPISGDYHFALYGTNGFYRVFKGHANETDLSVKCTFDTKRFNPQKPNGNIVLKIAALNGTEKIEITDNVYQQNSIRKKIGTKEENITLDLKKNHGWYDFSVRIKDNNHFMKRYAGHVETGEESVTDPYMGRVNPS
ncbi:MAG TPA: phospholipase C, phosphocholine-specific [Chitinophagaceae bacterium]|nr:phospholipase C, phosphocholine-specific [Chitinophagaceae bacterium]